MKLSELKARQGKVDIEVEIVEISAPREFQKMGSPGRIATALVKDDSGEMKMALWNDEIDRVKAGDRVKITNGFVNEFQGEKQLTAGRYGKLEVLKS